MKGKKITTEEFVKQSREIHGDKYDYSKVEYHGYHEKVCIICPKHGEFWQTPHKHIYEKSCCPQCVKENRKYSSNAQAQEKFLNCMKKIHGDKINFSEANYVNNDTKVKCKCNICGHEWYARPSKLKKKQGCPKCSLVKNGKNRQTTKDIFIKKVNELFGEYDFSKVPDRIRQKDKIEIGCPIHGYFLTTADAMIHGHGCRKCANDKLSKKFSWDLKTFVKKAKNVHGDKYIYDKVIYKGIDEKVKIFCPIHGEFWQTPYCHIHMKHGCPSCNQSHLEEEINLFLCENKIEFIQGSIKDKFDWLKRQHLDFYLPKYNIAIECQGEQHYRPFSFSRNKGQKIMNENLLLTKERDQRKKLLCNENGVKLLYFTHYEGIEADNIETFKDKEKLLEEILKQ